MGLSDGQQNRSAGLEGVKHGRGSGRGCLELRDDVFRGKEMRQAFSGIGGWGLL